MTTQTMQIAKTILDQMGGTRRLALMTGAKNFMALESGVNFRIGKNAKNVNNVRVTLTPDDLYTVEFGKVWGTKYKVLSKHEGVYCDMLVDLFESETGMYLTF